MLTKQLLESYKPDQIFATGEIVDGPLGIQLTNSGNQLRWVAVRGRIPDWAIYCLGTARDIHSRAHSTFSETYVRDYGDKLYEEESILRLMPCDEEALKLYRFR